MVDLFFTLAPFGMFAALIALVIAMQWNLAKHSDWATLARLYPAGQAPAGKTFSMRSGYVGRSYLKGMLFIGVSSTGLSLRAPLCADLLLPWNLLSKPRERGFWSTESECFLLTPQGPVRLRLGNTIWMEAAPYLKASRVQAITEITDTALAAAEGEITAARNVRRAAFCSHCGSPLSRATLAKFCMHCGRVIAS